MIDQQEFQQYATELLSDVQPTGDALDDGGLGFTLAVLGIDQHEASVPCHQLGPNDATPQTCDVVLPVCQNFAPFGYDSTLGALPDLFLPSTRLVVAISDADRQAAEPPRKKAKAAAEAKKIEAKKREEAAAAEEKAAAEKKRKSDEKAAETKKNEAKKREEAAAEEEKESAEKKRKSDEKAAQTKKEELEKQKTVDVGRHSRERASQKTRYDSSGSYHSRSPLSPRRSPEVRMSRREYDELMRMKRQLRDERY